MTGRPSVAEILAQVSTKGRARLVVTHTCTFQDVQGVLPLGHEYALRAMLNKDAQKVMQSTQILHRELLLQS
jgi:hypothetical protein